jgi:hypothetical protein
MDAMQGLTRGGPGLAPIQRPARVFERVEHGPQPFRRLHMVRAGLVLQHQGMCEQAHRHGVILSEGGDVGNGHFLGR